MSLTELSDVELEERIGAAQAKRHDAGDPREYDAAQDEEDAAVAELARRRAASPITDEAVEVAVQAWMATDGSETPSMRAALTAAAPLIAAEAVRRQAERMAGDELPPGLDHVLACERWDGMRSCTARGDEARCSGCIASDEYAALLATLTARTAEVEGLRAELADLRGLMAEARDDFHGKTVLMSCEFLAACEGTDRSSHLAAKLFASEARSVVAQLRRERAEAERDAALSRAEKAEARIAGFLRALDAWLKFTPEFRRQTVAWLRTHPICEGETLAGILEALSPDPEEAQRG